MSGKPDRTTPVDPTAELLRLGAVNRELRAENERLRAELTEAGVALGQSGVYIERTRAENERLRAALTEIADLELEGDASLQDAMVIADEALHPSPAETANV